MIFIIVYNYFCYTIGLDTFKINIDNFKKIFVLEVISCSLYTYIGNILTLMFMEKEKYKQILIVSIPISLMVFLIHTFGNFAIANIFLIFIYFMYRYLNNGIGTVVSTLGYLIVILLIQFVFYFMKYDFFNIDYMELDNNLVRMLLGFDYYLFLGVTVIVKNKIMKEV